MSENEDLQLPKELAELAQKLIALERRFYYDLSNSDTQRRKKVRDLIDSYESKPE